MTPNAVLPYWSKHVLSSRWACFSQIPISLSSCLCPGQYLSLQIWGILRASAALSASDSCMFLLWCQRQRRLPKMRGLHVIWLAKEQDVSYIFFKRIFTCNMYECTFVCLNARAHVCAWSPAWCPWRSEEGERYKPSCRCLELDLGSW